MVLHCFDKSVDRFPVFISFIHFRDVFNLYIYIHAKQRRTTDALFCTKYNLQCLFDTRIRAKTIFFLQSN